MKYLDVLVTTFFASTDCRVSSSASYVAKPPPSTQSGTIYSTILYREQTLSTTVGFCPTASNQLPVCSIHLVTWYCIRIAITTGNQQLECHKTSSDFDNPVQYRIVVTYLFLLLGYAMPLKHNSVVQQTNVRKCMHL